MANNTTQKQAARQFVQDWSGKGYEKGETARFWIALLQNVYGIQDATKFMEFELPVKTILKEKGGLLAISEDEMTSQQRRYHYGPGYVNIDDAFGVVVSPAKQMMLDAPRNNNSVLTALLCTSYDDQPRHYKKGDVVDRRHIMYYSNVNRQQTARLARQPDGTPRPAGTPAR